MSYVYLGGYTRRDNKGIHKINLESDDKMERELILEEGPSYLAIDKAEDMLYTVTSRNGGGIAAYKKMEDGYLRVSEYFGMQKPPCHIFLDEKRDLIYASNYHLGRVDIFRNEKQGLVLLNSIIIGGENSKCHMAILDREEEYLIVVNLGTDTVYTYEIDSDANYNLKYTYKTSKGMGPRHLCFGKGKRAYLIGELNNSIDVLEYDKGRFSKISNVGLLDEKFNGESSAAAIKESKGLIYASNRGEDSIAVFKQVEEGLELVQRVYTGGRNPRDFGIDKEGEILIVGHQDSEVVNIFKIYPNGLLEEEPKQLLELDEIICVVFD